MEIEKKFNIGDFVCIKQWDDMEREFGIGDYGSINCRFKFTPDMKELCGKEFEITGFLNEKVCGIDTHYSISADMIEHVDYSSFEFSKELDEYLNEFNK